MSIAIFQRANKRLDKMRDRKMNFLTGEVVKYLKKLLTVCRTGGL